MKQKPMTTVQLVRFLKDLSFLLRNGEYLVKKVVKYAKSCKG